MRPRRAEFDNGEVAKCQLQRFGGIALQRSSGRILTHLVWSLRPGRGKASVYADATPNRLLLAEYFFTNDVLFSSLRVAIDFVKCGHSLDDLANSVDVKCFHSLIYGLFADLHR